MRRRSKRLLVAALALSCATLAAAQSRDQAPVGHPRARRLELEVANVDRGGRLCMRHSGPALPPGVRIWLVQPDAPQTVARAEPGAGSCAPWPDSAERPLIPLRVVAGTLDSTRLSIAVVAPVGAPAARRGVVVADLDGDGQAERFRACASSEGLHLAVWTGAPPGGRLRWHRYFYLGYDVQPDCTAADVGEPTPGAALGRRQR